MSAADEEFESPDALLRRIYDEDFGFLPTNSSMKPVRAVVGEDAAQLGFEIKRVVVDVIGQPSPVGERLDLLEQSTGSRRRPSSG